MALHGSSSVPQTVVDQVEAAGARHVQLTADLRDPDRAAELVEQTIAALGSIDILINNAGMIRRAPAVDFTTADWNDVLATNLTSVFRLSQSAGRHMLKQGSGKIINIASLLSFQGGVTVPSYAAAKGGIAQLTKALANEWAAKGVQVNAIAPGYMETDNTEALRKDPTRSRQIWNAFRQADGDHRKTSRERLSFSLRRRATISTDIFWPSMAAGWVDRGNPCTGKEDRMQLVSRGSRCSPSRTYSTHRRRKARLR